MENRSMRTGGGRSGNLRGMLSVAAGAVFIGLVSWTGAMLRDATDSPFPHQPQAFDAQRQLLFVAAPQGAVRVLNLRNGVSEIAMLRDARRSNVHEVVLDASRHALLVRGDDALYRYDARTLRLTGRESTDALVEAAIAPAVR